MFDSHIAMLLDQAVALVNTLTDGTARGRPYAAPCGTGLRAAVDAAIPRTASSLPRDIDDEQAAYLAGAARRMRDVFQAMQDGRLDAAAAAVNDLLRDTDARPRLDRGAGESWQLHFHGPDDSFAAGSSAACATALALAVGGGLAGRLGVCRADRCDRVYVDLSRNAARRFCSTACQNRAKAAAFRARQDARDSHSDARD
ncbi:CGNR zinc finger domain-containing protein [Streptomyces sp. SCA3-4]|uniref:CGNR zinc finger domain-containing protein n=1 Tax=Streptomyces sichuanensis TaxID=2871810 RepID=UPI001CE23828|nr:CGNR zinc finger domain-containing protein [Streptomyces sichuanensis]MCA6091820.1 CGNR zinc finger domain-containing protein [Streptomyces sichuanensis]